MFREYVRVMLVTDRYEKEGVYRGMVGYIIEVYPPENYEVEFSDPATGNTIAQLVVSDPDIVVDPEGGSDGPR